MSTELETLSGAELEKLEALEADLARAQEEEYDQADLVVPILKIGQPLTDEVTDGVAAAGDFINSLTRESLGDEIEFIVSKFEKGRFYVKEINGQDRTFVASGTKVIPDSWKDAVGEQYVSTPFSEYPDAEETYKARVNAGDIAWDHGPPISTTFNFTGYVAGTDVPVRLSLMRTATPAARKWQTLLRMNRGRPTWDTVFNVTTDSQEPKKGKGTYYIPVVTQGRKSETDERQRAVELALALNTRNVEEVGSDALAKDESGAEKPQGEDTGISVD